MIYDMGHDLKSIRKQFAEKGVFYTDTKLAEILRDLITVDYGEVYDPTCGDGGLLSVFPDHIAKYGQEIDAEQLAVASSRLVNFKGAVGDTLSVPAFREKKFRAIVANPPFSVKWTPNAQDERFAQAPAVAPPSKADYAFLLHILHYLADDGLAAVLNFPGILYRGNAEGKIRRWLVEQNVIAKVIFVEGDYFVDTKIATAIVLLSKSKDTTDIAFAELKSGRERVVPLREIEENDFNLSVSCYLREERTAEPAVDPLALETKARQACTSRIRKELEFSKAVCDIEGWNIRPFITDIKKTVRNFEYECRTDQNGQHKIPGL